MHVHFPFVVDFKFRFFEFQRVEFYEGAQVLGCCHFLDQLLQGRRKFRKQVVPDEPFYPVDAAAVVPD